MFNNLPPEVQNATANISSSQQSEGVRLPFPVSYARWVNGEPRNKRLGDVTYYGGWAISADMLETQISETGQALLPGFTKTTLAGEQGDYEAYIGRGLSIARICQRKRWLDDERTSHIQILCYAAEITAEKDFVPWGQLVLTAKGFSGMNIEKALDAWGSATAQARRTHANNLPPFAFYSYIGTFGNEPVTEQVGKTVKHPITPCRLWLPQDLASIDLDFLTKRYVGNEILLLMSELAKQAEPWRLAWKKEDGDTSRPSNSSRQMDDEPSVAQPDDPPF